MAEAGLDNRALLRKTLVTMGAMLGACVVVVGTLTLVALGVTGHAVGGGDPAAAGDAGLVVLGGHGTTLGAPPGVTPPPPLPKKK